MDDFRLKVFITAARTLSFTRTAERLFISQPAVSKHIGELESQYKVQLFMRRGSRLELTGAGETLLACAERLADDYRRMQYEMSLCADAPVGELRLGASTTIISVKSFDNTKDFLICRRHLIQKRFKLPFRFAIPKFFA